MIDAPRIFSVLEAERTLPLVRRVVGDLMATFPVWRQAIARYELLTGPLRADSGETEAVHAARESVSHEAERIQDYLEELARVGCIFKGFEGGLVDFYALREDRLVFLCWKLGEDHISHWHEVESGFDGRQPIDNTMLMEIIA